MFAYVDETGNTGANLFDIAQPDFFTAALITKTNFDLLKGSAIKSLCRSIGVDALHASVLGFEPIEKIAPSLLAILKDSDARFFFSRVEKRYLLATKVFDTFFDSGENPAAPWMVYNFRLLRLILCFKVATIINYDIAEKFWAMLMAKKEADARAMIPGICDALLENVHQIVDQRSRDIITDALTWSQAHPEALDIFIAGRQAKNGHMPNMVAFVNLLQGLEHFSKRWNRPLRRIVHDRQSQFENTLKEWHRLFSNASGEPIYRLGETYVLQMVKGSAFDVSASGQSGGIQVADMILWLHRQMLAKKSFPPGCAKLLNHAFRKGWLSDFSFDGVGKIAEEAYREMMAKELPDDALTAAAKMQASLEAKRKSNIALYEKDSLMPYQREQVKMNEG